MSRLTRLTRAEKVALMALSERYKSAAELKATPHALDRLHDRGLCDISLEMGSPTYRLNQAGAGRRGTLPVPEGAE